MESNNDMIIDRNGVGTDSNTSGNATIKVNPNI